MVTWQTLVQVGKRSANVPSELRVFFASISILQLDTTSVLHPACYSSSPFNLERNQFIVSIIMWTVAATSFLLSSTRLSKFIAAKTVVTLATVCRFGMAGLTLTYPMLAGSALSMVHCSYGRTLGDYSQTEAEVLVLQVCACVWLLFKSVCCFHYSCSVPRSFPQ
jgi:hypothetical protein